MKVSKVSLEYYAVHQANILRMQETSRQNRIETDRKAIEKQRVEKLDPKRSADLKLGRHIDIEV
jgi:membrane protein involved in colicin uptake